MAARSKARKRALDILFEADVRREPPLSVLEARTIHAEPPVGSYAIELVRGVQAHREELDRLLGENSHGWTLDRMPAVDRNILRIGGYELLWGTQVITRTRHRPRPAPPSTAAVGTGRYSQGEEASCGLNA